MDWERREFARTAPAAAPRRSPDGETLPALSVLHLPEGERQRRWIHEEFFSRFFPPPRLPRSDSQPRLLPAPLAARRGVGGRKGMLGGFGKKGEVAELFQPCSTCARRGGSGAVSIPEKSWERKEGGREFLAGGHWVIFGGGDLGPRVLPGFSASNKARSLRFPSKNWVRKDDFFLSFCEEGWGFPLLFFSPSSPQIPYFQPLSSHHPKSHFSSLSPSPGPGAAGVAVTSPSCDPARALPIPCAAGKKRKRSSGNTTREAAGLGKALLGFTRAGEELLGQREILGMRDPGGSWMGKGDPSLLQVGPCYKIK